MLLLWVGTMSSRLVTTSYCCKGYKPGYYRSLMWVVTIYSRLVTYSYCCHGLLCILITSGMPKTEAINWRLVSKSTAHISSGKIHSMEDQVTTCCCCEWLLCLLGWCLQASAVKGYHIFLLQVVCQKRKPQIDGWFLSLLHIYGQEKSFQWKTRLLHVEAVVSGYYVFYAGDYKLLL